MPVLLIDIYYAGGLIRVNPENPKGDGQIKCTLLGDAFLLIASTLDIRRSTLPW